MEGETTNFKETENIRIYSIMLDVWPLLCGEWEQMLLSLRNKNDTE